MKNIYIYIYILLVSIFIGKCVVYAHCPIYYTVMIYRYMCLGIIHCTLFVPALLSTIGLYK